MKIIKANNFKDAEIGAISGIVPNSLHEKYIVITPDRYSLNLEKNIFDILKVDSLFNVSVMGISRFAKKMLSSTEKQSVSALGTLILVRLAIIRVQSKLKCFKDINFGLCEEIKNTISLLKSAGISCEEGFNVSSQGLKAKLEDIFTIYREYENLLEGRLDSAGLLNELEIKLDEIDLKDTIVLFVGFDSLTKQGMSILSKICDTAKDVWISIVEPFFQPNSYVYERDLFNKVRALNKEVSVLEIPCSLTGENKHILENLFAFRTSVMETNKVKLYSAPNVEGEVLMLARKIKRLIVSGYRYKDISVAVAGLQPYEPFIERLFDKFDFSYYIDDSKPLIDLFPIKFILNVLNLLLYDFKKEDLISYILSPFSEVENKDEKINYIIKYDIDQNKSYVEENFEKLASLIKIFKNTKSLIEFTENILKIYNFEEKIIDFTENFAKNNQIKLEKTFLQLYEKIVDVLNTLKDFNINETLFDFIKILETAFSSLKISTVPASVDNIVISDATSGFFTTAEFMFVIGATDSLPSYISDCGVITDKDIDEIKISAKIEPTVRMINRRNKFKLLSVFTAFNKKLIVSYPESALDEKQNLPSSIIKDLKNMFTFSGRPLPILTDDYISTGENLEKEAEMLAYLAIDNSMNLNTEKFNPIVTGTFKALNQVEEKVEALTGALLKERVPVTEVETYFACPFKRFASYNLKLKEKETSELTPADIGSFVHAYLEKIIFSPESVDVQSVLNELFSKEKFYKFNLKKNKPNKEILIKEMFNLTDFLIKTQNLSNFKPFLCEKKVNYKISTNKNQYNLIGVIDRVDTYKNYFRIIDYKTGGRDLGGYPELYYGEKLQLFLYLKSAEKELKLIPCGVFYFKIKNNEQKLNGFFIDNFEVLHALDTSLNFEHPASDIVKSLKIKTNKENKKDGIIEYYSAGITPELLYKLESYAEEVTKGALYEIEEGNISPNPTESACNFCAFGALCKFSSKSPYRTREYKIDKNTFGGEDDKG